MFKQLHGHPCLAVGIKLHGHPCLAVAINGTITWTPIITWKMEQLHGQSITWTPMFICWY
ncbi:hypothetical protein GCM10027170_23570 [Aliiglaciecola aliphaticivorans]